MCMFGVYCKVFGMWVVKFYWYFELLCGVKGDVSVDFFGWCD